MKKRSILMIAAVVVVAVVFWLGGQALWNMLLAMHGRGR